MTSSLNDEQRQLVTNLTLTLLGALNSNILPQDLKYSNRLYTEFNKVCVLLSENINPLMADVHHCMAKEVHKYLNNTVCVNVWLVWMYDNFHVH